MFSKNDALRAIPVHPLEIPDFIIVIYLRAKHVAPTASHSLRYEVVIKLPILPDRFHIRAVTRIAVPGGIHCKMYAITRSVVGLIVIHDVMKFVGRNNQRSVVGTVGSNASIGILARLREAGDVVAYPSPSSVTCVDSALGMIALEFLKQLPEVLIGAEGIRIVGTCRRCDIVAPLKISPRANSVV